jgi:hypothetical protein
MNERIREFAAQATTYIEPTATSGEGWIFDKEKFAELIVQECADIAQQHNKSPVAAPLAIGYVIREHFGVEE